MSPLGRKISLLGWAAMQEQLRSTCSTLLLNNSMREFYSEPVKLVLCST